MVTGAATLLDLHATTVALEGRGVVIFGPSGAGKSGLGLELMAMGARLVCDDRTRLERRGEGLRAAAPEGLPPLIEARGVGLLETDGLEPAAALLAVDLGRTEGERLPPRRSVTWLGVTLPLLHKVESPHFAAAIRQYLLHGRGA